MIMAAVRIEMALYGVLAVMFVLMFVLSAIGECDY